MVKKQDISKFGMRPVEKTFSTGRACFIPFTVCVDGSLISQFFIRIAMRAGGDPKMENGLVNSELPVWHKMQIGKIAEGAVHQHER